MRRVQVVDSHTGGEPTRVVVAGGPELGAGSLAQRRDRFRADFDPFRRAVVCEPRGSDVLVGALLTPPENPASIAGVIFFNNVGYLGMCGHGMMGVAVTLGHLGRIAAGRHLFDTPVGQVSLEYDGRAAVTIDNVPSYRQAAGVKVNVPGLGEVIGDVAWGGNWFFIVHRQRESLELANVQRLSDMTRRIRAALLANGITGADGAEIDHVELFAPPRDPHNHGRNFVACPGGAFDRSPCGTGTSAKLACLAADGKLSPGDLWRQESILGTVFTASYQMASREALAPGVAILPRICGEAYVTAEATLLIDDADPFAWGIQGPV
jgi:4-hydroxyproline epimerase